MFITLALLYLVKGKRLKVKGIEHLASHLNRILCAKPFAFRLSALSSSYNLLFTSRQFKSPNATFKRFTKLSSPLRNQTRGS